MENLLDDLKKLLETDERLVDKGKLYKNKIMELALKLDKDLLKLLFSNDKMKKVFFIDIEGVFICLLFYVFNNINSVLHHNNIASSYPSNEKQK